MAKDALRKQILGDRQPRVEAVTIRSLGAALEVLALPGGQVFDIRAASLDEEAKAVDNKKFWPGLVIAAYRDPETHAPLFTEGDRDALLALEYAALEELASHVYRLCSIDRTKSEEDLLKNSSSGTPISGAASSSPSGLAG